MFHLLDEAGWSHKGEGPGAVQPGTQQPIEPGEMVHMGVRNERVADAQQLT